MKNSIQNIFMDMKSYELIQNTIALDELISLIQNKVHTMDTHSITINNILFKVEFHPKNDYLGHTHTINGFHYILHDKCRFKNSVYLYVPEILSEYEDGFSGITLLLFTTKKFLYAIPSGENDLSIIDSESGKFTRRL